MSADEKEYIEIWKTEVAQRLGWSAEQGVKQRDYAFLSQEIFGKTQVELSTTTLRRIWSNEYKGLPQVHTLNAMALYLDFADWHTFKLQYGSQKAEPVVERQGSKAGMRLWAALGLLMVVALVLRFAFAARNEEVIPEVSLSSDQQVYQGVPATAGLSYDISQATQPVFIELSWNPMERTELDPAGNFYTGVYYYPDYHQTKLISDDQVLTSMPVYVTTDNWHALVMKEENDIKPAYIEPKDYIRNGQMGFDMATLEDYLLEPPKTIYSVFTLSNQMLEQFRADDLRLEVGFTVLEDKSSPVCTGLDVLYKAENGNARIPVRQKGCYGEIGLLYGGKALTGKNNDMSVLTANLNQEQKLSIQSRGGQVEITLGENAPYRLSYEEALGELKVLKFIFTSLGTIQKVSLTGPEGQSYFEDFEDEVH